MVDGFAIGCDVARWVAMGCVTDAMGRVTDAMGCVTDAMGCDGVRD